MEEGSFAGVLALPDVSADDRELDMGLEQADLGYLAWLHLMDTLYGSSDDIDPELARSVVQLADSVNLGGRTTHIRLESTDLGDEPRRSAVIDGSTRQRMAAASTRPEAQRDAVYGRLMEADFENYTARLRLPNGGSVKITFTDELAGDIQAVLREPGTFVGDVVYSRVSNQASDVRLSQVVSAGEQLELFGDFRSHRAIEELAAEQGVSEPQQLEELRTSIVDDDELAAFVAAAEEL